MIKKFRKIKVSLKTKLTKNCIKISQRKNDRPVEEKTMYADDVLFIVKDVDVEKGQGCRVKERQQKSETSS